MRSLERLYHLAEAENLPSIFAHGLLSTESLLGLTGLPETDRAAFLRRHRPDAVRLAEGVVIRDQRPMPPDVLAKVLDGGMEPGDWYALLNAHVFLWPDRDRADRHRRACDGRPQVLLVFDAAALFDAFGSQAFVSPINSGNARRKAARRNPDTLMPLDAWQRQGWPTGLRLRPPAEILFRCPIPAQPPYLLEIADPQSHQSSLMVMD